MPVKWSTLLPLQHCMLIKLLTNVSEVDKLLNDVSEVIYFIAQGIQHCMLIKSEVGQAIN